MISLEAAGFTVGNYYSSEIDKHAIKASEACSPNAMRLGDVRNVSASDLPKIDLFGGVIKESHKKMNALKCGGKGVEDLVRTESKCVAMRGRGENNEQQLEPRHDNKTNAITSVQKDNLIICHNTMPRASKTGKGGTGPL